MKASTLKNRIAKSQNANGTTPKNRDYEFAMEVIMTGICRPGYYTGSGRYTRSSVASPEVYLNTWGIDFETGNNAPRGGVSGMFVKLTKKGDRQVKAYVQEVQEEKARINAENEAKEMARRAENEKKAKEGYANIKELDFFQLWNDSDVKQASGMSWRDYRNYLKKANPEGWAELKELFKKNQKK